MIESIEGKRGIPRHRPPFVAQVGIFDRPTLVHNVETLYWVARVCREGPEVLAGTEKNGRKGLRSYSVSGRVAQPGVHLLPAGSTIREVIEAAGGMAEGHVFKAYQPGGPSSGLLPASMDDIPLDFDTLQPHGSFIGSAAVVVLSDHDSARDAALNMLRFFEDESCGQCTPCRVGCEKAVKLMQAEKWDTGLLEELSKAMVDASICGLGQAAPNPIRLTIKHFADEIGAARGLVLHDPAGAALPAHRIAQGLRPLAAVAAEAGKEIPLLRGDAMRRIDQVRRLAAHKLVAGCGLGAQRRFGRLAGLGKGHLHAPGLDRGFRRFRTGKRRHAPVLGHGVAGGQKILRRGQAHVVGRGRGIAPGLGRKAGDDRDIVDRLACKPAAFQKPFNAALAAVVADGGKPEVAIPAGHFGKILRGMLQRVGGIVGIRKAAQVGGRGNELCDPPCIGMGQRVGIKAAFLPDQPREKTAVQSVPVRKDRDSVTGIIDKMRRSDAVGVTPFLA